MSFDLHLRPLRIVAHCPDCAIDVQITRVPEVRIDPLPDGGAVLMDKFGRALICPFCKGPMDGALFRGAEIARNN